MHTRIAAAVGVLMVCAWTATDRAQGPAASAATSRATERAARLRHGVNVTNWLRQLGDGRSYSKAQFETVTAQDLALIRAMGFDHVRLSVNPEPLFRPLQADRIPSEPLRYVDTAIRMILDAGLAVDLDIQPDTAFKRRLSDDSFVEQFTDFWRGLARHYAALDPDRVFFEILNEPELRDAYRWYGIEARLVTAIRDAAPEHTVIVTGAHWSDDDDLVFLEPLRDANVIYAFHFYQPFLFTHQGATWSENYWHFLRGVPYPSRPDAAEAAAARVPDPVHRLAVLRYGASHWDAERIDLEIKQVAEWAARTNVPVVCNEFGAYKPFADPRERLAWLGDVRAALEARGIGWSVWEYTGGFGVVTTEDGQTVPDRDTLRALGRTLADSATPSGSAAPH